MFENEKVIHKSFGDGIVQCCDEKYIFVKFPIGTKQFAYNTVFIKELLKFENKTLQEKIDCDFKEMKEVENQCNQKSSIIEELRKKTNIDKTQLLQTLHNFNFEGFLHTTELENFKKIVDMGYLIPRNALDAKHIPYIDSANQEIINNTGSRKKSYCRFYYYFKTPTNYKANYNHPVIMVFDENLIYEDNCYFTSENAAKDYIFPQDVTEALSFPWDAIFERGAYNQSKLYFPDENGDFARSRKKITGVRNAEFLISKEVSVSNITKIYFKYEEDLHKAKTFCTKDLISKFYLDRSKFD